MPRETRCMYYREVPGTVFTTADEGKIAYAIPIPFSEIKETLADINASSCHHNLYTRYEQRYSDVMVGGLRRASIAIPNKCWAKT